VEIEARLNNRLNGKSSASFGSAFGFTIKGLGVAFLGMHKHINPFRESSDPKV
jgi:hypothetical protein